MRNHYFLVGEAVFPLFESRLCVVYKLKLHHLLFCISARRSLMFVAIRTVFWSCCFPAVCACFHFYLRFNAFFSLVSAYRVFRPVLLFVEADPPLFGDKFNGSRKFFSGHFVILTSFSDQHWRSCIISRWNGGYIRFFQSEPTCFAFSQI